MSESATAPAAGGREADVVVVGLGGAGAAAAITAHDAGARVLVLEKAPQGREGGNTRVAAQGYLNPSSAEAAALYLSSLCGPFSVPDAMVKAWAEEMCRNNAWLASVGGDPQEHQHPPAGIEYPELPGSGCVRKFHHGPVVGYSETWGVLDRAVRARSIEVLYGAPGRELLQDPVTGEIAGVRAEYEGRALSVFARKATILTCGGFEANQEMVRDFLPGVTSCYPTGSPYNEGDGVRMAMAVGADLWHMNTFVGPSLAMKAPEFGAAFLLRPLSPAGEVPGGMIVVGPDGRRFGDEKARTRHGRVERAGRWVPQPTPWPMFMLLDQALLSSGPLHNQEAPSGWNPIVERYAWSVDNSAELEKGWIKAAEDLPSLARVLGLDPVVLQDTVDRWNESCRLGADREFGRSRMLSPLSHPPYYAVELSAAMWNTQGGPRRNERAQVLRTDGSPMPRLYSAGELGSIYGNLYQGTGNIGECFAFGRIAGANAAALPPRG